MLNKHIIPTKDVVYNEQDFLGQGGYGKVYQGEWSGNLVAIKTTLCQLNRDLEKEFEQEIKLMLDLNAPQVVRTYGFLSEPTIAIVMELMPNGSLYALLRKDRSLEWPTKYKIALDIAYGMKYLHDKHVLHRDLKSLNVLLDKDLNAKICDFGLAKIKNTSRTLSNVKPSGTICWMAPELFGHKSIFEKSSDIYALGMVFYEMLTHKIPFEDDLIGKDHMVVQVWIQNKARPDLPEDAPKLFSKLITECWTQERNLRPTAEKVVATLRPLVNLGNSFSSSTTNPPTGLASGPSYIPNTAVTISREVQLKAAQEAKTFAEQPVLFSAAAKPKPAAIATVSPQLVAQFLRHVGFGEQTEAEAMLQSTPSLAKLSGDLTDCAERQFKKITGFQYAVLALDYHMWTMIKKYLTQEDARTQLEELKRIATLNEQKGWIIRPEANTGWPSISWSPLINALEIYVENYQGWDGEQRLYHWCQAVGGAQLSLPAHVINEYRHPSRPLCSNEEVALPRTGVVDWRTAPSGKKLGSDFAWLREFGEGARMEVGRATAPWDVPSLLYGMVVAGSLVAAAIPPALVLAWRMTDSRERSKMVGWNAKTVTGQVVFLSISLGVARGTWYLARRHKAATLYRMLFLGELSELLKSRTGQARLLLESVLPFRPSSSSRPKFS